MFSLFAHKPANSKKSVGYLNNDLFHIAFYLSDNG